MWIAEVHRTAHPESQSGSYANVASGVISMSSPARRSRVDPTWVASTTGRLSNQTPVSLGNLQPGARRAPRESWLAPELARGRTPKPLRYGSQDRLATGLLHESKNLPLQPYQKTGSDNEDIPHEGHRQNRSAVYETPVSFGQLQPGTVLSFLQVTIRWSMRSKIG